MKNFSISITALTLALASGSAFAADLPTQKAPPVVAAPAPMWTGAYVGLNAGYNFGTNGSFYSQNMGYPATVGRVSTSPLAMNGIASNNQSGFMGGAQIGYNYQWGNNFVIGLEADITGTNTRGTSRTAGSFTEYYGTAAFNSVGSTTVNAGIDYLGTVRGRVGYLLTPTLLLYGTGGFAYGGASANVSQISLSQVNDRTTGAFYASNIRIGSGQQNPILTGWTAGGGVEWMFMPSWTLKTEALYWDLGRMDIGTLAYSWLSPMSSGHSNVAYSGVTARAGINYHFNFGGSAPVVAKF